MTTKTIEESTGHPKTIFPNDTSFNGYALVGASLIHLPVDNYICKYYKCYKKYKKLRFCV